MRGMKGSSQRFLSKRWSLIVFATVTVLSFSMAGCDRDSGVSELPLTPEQSAEIARLLPRFQGDFSELLQWEGTVYRGEDRAVFDPAREVVRVSGRKEFTDFLELWVREFDRERADWIRAELDKPSCF